MLRANDNVNITVKNRRTVQSKLGQFKIWLVIKIRPVAKHQPSDLAIKILLLYKNSK
jgi:hypothetical protein